MPPATTFLKGFVGRRHAGQIALLAAIHLAAAGLLLRFETEPAAQLAFVLSWGLLNFFWLSLLGRPLISAALALAVICLLIWLSQFKHSILFMTATFIDVMLIDWATVSFLLVVIPGLAWKFALVLALAIAAAILLWRIEPFRIARSVAALGGVLCFLGLAGLSIAVPTDREDEFLRRQYVSKFARSAAVAAVDLATQGIFEADAASPGGARLADGWKCDATAKRPHIVMVFDESNFDITMMPNVKVPANYRDQFRSSDGKVRSLVVEGAGGPSWYTEYNVLTGLSVRSYGRFAESVTRLAAGRVKRGLPYVLRDCGYKTYSLYSWFGAFVGARSFQTTAGIENFLDAGQLRTGPADTDSFYFDHAAKVIAQEHGPVFVLVYLAINHFPWTYRYRPDLLPDWVNSGNPLEIDEYLRRQEMSARDYAAFRARLAREFPDDRFLIVRFGDHQPRFAKSFMDPDVDEAEVGRRILARDARYFTTYYAVEGVNFRPVDLSSALDPLDAPYLPLVVLEAAGLPLDPTFAEQKKILSRCRGLFYLCADGAEARRFNRLLIDAGLIQGF